MAYPYPQYYQPNAFPTQQNVLPTQQTQQIQNGGFMVIPSEEMVKNYPVAPGNCVTFKVEGKPIVMEKSMGFSQFESPKIDRYRLVKEESEEVNESQEVVNDEHYEEIKTDIEKLWGAIDEIKASMEKPTEKPVTTRRKKDGED